jgi:diguanylate cyclase (GGDEF)-like protein/PAS domain S-box-containing protein
VVKALSSSGDRPHRQEAVDVAAKGHDLPVAGPAEHLPAPPPASEPSGERARAARATIEALTATPDVFETFFESARIGLALADLAGRFVRVNRTYAWLLGQEPMDLIGVGLGTVVGAQDPQLVRLLAGHSDVASAEQQYVLVDGTVRWLLHGVASVPGAGGQSAWYAVSAQDITERRHAEQELRELTATLTERAVRDPLTGLANRELLEERLRAALSHDARTGEATGALFLDLDGFKAVNDRHGHAVGDAVLRTIADRLVAVVRPSDTVARLGGDEFVVLVPTASEAGLKVLLERLRAEVSRPISVGQLAVAVGVSIGLALADGGESDPHTLLAQADARMYAAKRSTD